MQRRTYDTVTEGLGIPVLVPATAKDQEGLNTFEREMLPPRPVRRFRDTDLRNSSLHLTELEAKHFTAVVALVQALQDPSDSIALNNAKDKFDEVYRLRREGPRELFEGAPEFVDSLARMLGIPPIVAVEVFDGKRAGPRAAKDPRWLLSYEVSDGLSSSARLVLWWTGERLTPAIWCDDIKTAFYVRALLNVVGGKGLRICPHCSNLFFQDRPDQHYCSVAHREAHRVARWRAKQLSKSKKKGGKNVTHKTR